MAAPMWHCATCIRDCDENYCDSCGATLNETLADAHEAGDALLLATIGHPLVADKPAAPAAGFSRRVDPLTRAEVREVADVAGPTAAATMVGLDAVQSAMEPKRPLSSWLRMASERQQLEDADQHALQMQVKW
jgi:hypothetical protein